MSLILVTGPDGFVGTEICKALILKGESVRGAQWKTAPLCKGVESVVVGDIGPTTNWSCALPGIDAVIHLAARVHVMDETSDDPLTAFRKVNVEGTVRLAQQAAAHKVKRLVFLSSVKVNGEECETPYSEEDIPAPRDPYGVSKREAEKALCSIAEETGLEVVIIRSPLIYGPGVRANFLNMMKAIDRGIPWPLASVVNKRSLIYIGNLVSIILTCINHPDADEKTYLVSDCDDTSTPELIRRVAHALRKHPRLFSVPPSLLRLAGIMTGKQATIDRLLGSLTVDTTRIRRELGWTPPFTMEQGLRETALWYQGNLKDSSH